MGPSGPQGPAGANGVSGHQIVSTTVGPTTVNTKTATVSCPGGKSVVGGGFTFSGLAAPPYVWQNYPSAAGTWTVLVQENQAGSPTWTLVGYAVCVTALP